MQRLLAVSMDMVSLVVMVGNIYHLRMRRYPGDDGRGNACLNTVMDLVAFFFLPCVGQSISQSGSQDSQDSQLFCCNIHQFSLSLSLIKFSFMDREIFME